MLGTVVVISGGVALLEELCPCGVEVLRKYMYMYIYIFFQALPNVSHSSLLSAFELGSTGKWVSDLDQPGI